MRVLAGLNVPELNVATTRHPPNPKENLGWQDLACACYTNAPPGVLATWKVGFPGRRRQTVPALGQPCPTSFHQVLERLQSVLHLLDDGKRPGNRILLGLTGKRLHDHARSR